MNHECFIGGLGCRLVINKNYVKDRQGSHEMFIIQHRLVLFIFILFFYQ